MYSLKKVIFLNLSKSYQINKIHENWVLYFGNFYIYKEHNYLQNYIIWQNGNNLKFHEFSFCSNWEPCCVIAWIIFIKRPSSIFHIHVDNK